MAAAAVFDRIFAVAVEIEIGNFENKQTKKNSHYFEKWENEKENALTPI